MNDHNLFYAIESGNIKAVEKYINVYEVNINSQKNRDKDSALTLALKNSNNILALYFINKGINIHLYNDRGDNALILASTPLNEDILDILIQKSDIDIDYQNNYGDTAFIMACHRGILSIVEKLYNAGANINIRNKYGQTGLLCAVSMGKIDVVKFLVNNGAKMDYRNMWSETVFMAASRNNYNEILKYLIDAYTKKCFIGDNAPSNPEEARFKTFRIEEDFYINEIISNVKMLIALYCIDHIDIYQEIDIYSILNCSF
jgi:ankyrin repeat protein